MKAEYDLSKMKPRRNPYAAKLKTPISIRLSPETIAHFRSIAAETGMPYQRVINLYLDDCAARDVRLDLSWRPRASVRR